MPLEPPVWPSENTHELAHVAGTDQVSVVVCPSLTVVGLAESDGVQEFTVTDEGVQVAESVFPFDVTSTLAVFAPVVE